MQLPLTLAYVLALCIGACATCLAQGTREDPRALEAQALLDDYFGDRNLLDAADKLVQRALADEPRSVLAHIQAARIALLKGHIVGQTYRPGALEEFRAALARAIALDPKNLDALTLQVLSYEIAKDANGALSTIKRGLDLDPSDPRLRMSLAKYYESIGDWQNAAAEYKGIVTKGRGTDRNQRRAYLAALHLASRLYAAPEYIDGIRKAARMADAARSPNDAWTLGNFAWTFGQIGFFDDAIAYQRKALSVMHYGVGRRALAMFLYGKAAQNVMEGRDATALIREAASLKVSAQEVLAWANASHANVQALVPTLTTLLARNK